MVSGIVSQSGSDINSTSGQSSQNMSHSTPASGTVNITQLRQSLKDTWLGYYCENREWLVQLSIWVTCEGKHRPSSSFILATLTALEPQITRLMPLLSGLNSSPDRIISALGLNFNPDDLAEQWLQERREAAQTVLLPSSEENLDVAFHPEAVLMKSSVTEHQASNGKNGHSANPQVSSNGPHENPLLNASHDVKGGNRKNPSAFGKGNPRSSPDPQVIARQDEHCSGRDHPDDIWR